MKKVELSAGDMQALRAGTKTRAVVPLDQRVPQNFLVGDVAPITNGELWALSNSGWGAGTRGAWPPDPKPGLAFPWGAKGDKVMACEQGFVCKPDCPPVLLEMVKYELVRLLDIEDSRASEISPAGRLEGETPQKCLQRLWAAEHAVRLGREPNEQNPWVWLAQFVVEPS